MSAFNPMNLAGVRPISASQHSLPLAKMTAFVIRQGVLCAAEGKSSICIQTMLKSSLERATSFE